MQCGDEFCDICYKHVHRQGQAVYHEWAYRENITPCSVCHEFAAR